jgi:hypothetical protein
MGWVVLFGLAVAHIFLTVAAHESVPVFGQKNVYYLASLPMTDRFPTSVRPSFPFYQIHPTLPFMHTPYN